MLFMSFMRFMSFLWCSLMRTGGPLPTAIQARLVIVFPSWPPNGRRADLRRTSRSRDPDAGAVCGARARRAAPPRLLCVRHRARFAAADRAGAFADGEGRRADPTRARV